jgi:AraC-like DNA-binding protein
MDVPDCDKLNALINGLPTLREGFYLSSFLIQPHVFHVTALSQESQPPEHSHPTFEISMVLEGRITYCVGAHENTLSSGDLSIIPPYRKHTWRQHGVNTVISNFMCFISGKSTHPRRQMADFLDVLERRRFHVKQFSKYEKAQRDILALLREPLAFREEELRNLQELSYIQLLLEMLPGWKDSERSSKQPGIDSSPEKIVDRIKLYIFDNFLHPIHLEDLRRHFGLSENHLNRLFRKGEGVSIGQFIAKERVKRAARMLATTDCDIKTVALENGFSDLNYFCCAFKRHTGKTPSEFRHDSRNT